VQLIALYGSVARDSKISDFKQPSQYWCEQSEIIVVGDWHKKHSIYKYKSLSYK